MNKKWIIPITILLLLVGGYLVINQISKNTINIACTSPEEGCVYKETSGFGKELINKEFKYSDIMQCNIQEHYSEVKGKEIIDNFDFYLYINYGNDMFSFNHKDGKKLASICTYIFDKTPFNYKFRVKRSENKK